MSAPSLETAKDWARKRFWARASITVFVYVTAPVWLPLFALAVLVWLPLVWIHDGIWKDDLPW